LKGFTYEDQHGRWNYCGPTNFAMALSFWGWGGNRDVVGSAVMPANNLDSKGMPRNVDKNVMPYEFQDFISGNVPGITSIMRYGGDINVVRRLLAAGYPVVAEKGYYEADSSGKVGWMGHYQFITGYNDATREVIVQDTYLDGPDFHISYDDFMEGWRSFNFVFVVVYPANNEREIMALLGPLSDQYAAARHALEMAEADSQSLDGIDRFFAWFNLGTSHVALQEYADAAAAYDNAFQLYAQLKDSDSTRPYRIMWYQTGPYWAYYYTARYLDVISLANTTLKVTIAAPVLEESLLWRARAYYMTGQTQPAINDYRAALRVHPDWGLAVQGLQDLGLQP
jgi:tetratricopeptide (TPR) repeat protein